ncbi:MAG: YbjQ family protein [Flavipsychrobacter sp.]|nr:YbjQ family protein [Flavipsychrobacter sp.]
MFTFMKKTMVDNHLITTANSLEGYRIVQQLGVIRGITVRSRSVLGNIAGGVQSFFGGELSIFVELCEKARENAYIHMIEHANAAGANAIINMRYDANEVMQGITEVLAYGTAVVVEKI